MSYDTLKILHLISATLLLTTMVVSIWTWTTSVDRTVVMHQLQKQTGILIVPLAMLQLVSGFTMISMKHYDLSQIWIMASITGFVLMMTSWLGFIYCLFVSSTHRRLQTILLVICISTLLGMIFFMVNKI